VNDVSLHQPHIVNIPSQTSTLRQSWPVNFLTHPLTTALLSQPGTVYYPIPYHILSYPILSYPILSYPIISYPYSTIHTYRRTTNSSRWSKADNDKSGQGKLNREASRTHARTSTFSLFCFPVLISLAYTTTCSVACTPIIVSRCSLRCCGLKVHETALAREDSA
jgi:hypothetical protein